MRYTDIQLLASLGTKSTYRFGALVRRGMDTSGLECGRSGLGSEDKGSCAAGVITTSTGGATLVESGKSIEIGKYDGVALGKAGGGVDANLVDCTICAGLV